MSLKSFLNNLFNSENLKEAKHTAELSEQDLDAKIKETRDASASVIHRAREEIKQSKKIILVAEQAIRSMKQVENKH